MCKVKNWITTLTDVVEITKKEYLLTIATSLFCGIILGFVFSPKRTKYTMIGSHNGNGNNTEKDPTDLEEE